MKKLNRKEVQLKNHPKEGAIITVQPIKTKHAIERIKKDLKSNPRNFALFVIGINTNLRASDLLNIKVGQVRKQDKLILRETKTHKKREIPLNVNCIAAINNLLETESFQDSDYLFQNARTGTKLTVPAFSLLVKKWCGNLKGNYASHSLRKTWGYHRRIDKIADIPTLMVCFNHSSQEQTLRYLGIDNEEIEDVFSYTL